MWDTNQNGHFDQIAKDKLFILFILFILFDLKN